jgi:dihydrofolate reductase
MRKLINSTYLTLDGVVDSPMWSSPYFSAEAAEVAAGLTTGADALIMGRATYDGFSQAWPAMDESDPTTGAAFFNNVRASPASPVR